MGYRKTLTIKPFVAAAIACAVASMSGGFAARAATADTSTTVAAAPAANTAGAPAPAQEPRWLGVAMENIPPIFSHLLGLHPLQGLMVIQVIPGSPAFKAHLEPGDLLITLNGHALDSPFELIRAENRKGAAAPALNLTLIRAGVRKNVTLTPVSRPHRLIFFFPRRPEPAGVLPAGPGTPSDIQTTGLMTVGPGVRLHLPAAAVPSKGTGHPDLFSFKKWMGPHGTQHLQITWHQHVYDIQPGRLNRFPPPVQAVARLILHGQAPQHVNIGPSRLELIQHRMAELQALIQHLKLEEKQLRQQAAQCTPSAQTGR
jgi:hypothetical protein